MLYADSNFFVGKGVYILLFVDNMLVIGFKDPVRFIKKKILDIWKGKDVGEVDIFVGFQVERDRAKRIFRLYQTLYITKLLQRLRMENSNLTKIFFSANTVLKEGSEED